MDKQITNDVKSTLKDVVKNLLNDGMSEETIKKYIDYKIVNDVIMEKFKDPEADADCSVCHGMGYYDYGNECSGFGGEIKSARCNCVMYKKMGIDINNKTLNMKPINDDFLDKCAEITEAYDKKMGGWSLDSQLLHIISEVSELKDILRNKKDKNGNYRYGEPLSKEWYKEFYDELADVHLTVFATDNFLNRMEYGDGEIKLSNDELNQAIMRKLFAVEKRVKEI